jgi:UDP-N-acetylglucosamine--N-acetylmuramyl-(pentapeptide) pyrophosphoryl-undecaprenol N-acetylglucosamine transferase
MPDAIFGKGGFATVPTLVVGIIFGIPIFIHESDSIPGMVNQIFNRFSVKTFISFENSMVYFPHKHKLVLTGNPIREFLNISDLANIDQNKTKQLLGLQDKKPIVLVLGGSQGAQTINDLILEGLTHLLKNFEIIHQTGMGNFDSVKREAEIIFREYNVEKSLQNLYHPVAFLIESDTPTITSMKDCLIACDIVVARSGSGSIFEIAAFGKPAILIPLP